MGRLALPLTTLASFAFAFVPTHLQAAPPLATTEAVSWVGAGAAHNGWAGERQHATDIRA